MIAYLKYFKLQLTAGLQYRASAVAGIATQFFWGIMYIIIYKAFYTATGTSMSFESLITYVWLNQSFLALIFFYYRDKEFTESIRNGEIAYEIVKPYNLYFWWYFKIIAKKYASVMLRCLPILIVAFFLPSPYNLSLPASPLNAGLFIVTLGLGSMIIVGIIMIIFSITFYTISDDGISRIIIIIAEFLSGFVLPIPLLPDFLQKITYFLPFRLVGDLAFRVYSNDIGINDALLNIIFQVVWIIILLALGNLLVKNALKKIHIHGG